VARFGPFCGGVWYPLCGENWYTLSYYLHQIWGIAEVIAKEYGIEIEFIRKLKAFRKDERIQ